MKKAIIIIVILIVLVLISGTIMYYFEGQFLQENDFSEPDWFEEQYDSLLEDIYERKQEGIILVGVYDSGYLYHNAHAHGISTDVIIELFTRLGVKYKISEMPRARISSMIEEGSIPVGVSTIATPERAEYSYFIPYFAQKNEVLIRADSLITTLEEFSNNKNLKFGIVRGYYYGEYYQDMIAKLKAKDMVVEARDIEELYNMLDKNWIQATVNNAASYLFYLDYYNIEEIEIYDWDPNPISLVRNLVFSKKYFTSEDIKIIQETIDQMHEDGTIYNILNSYLTEKEIERMCRF